VYGVEGAKGDLTIKINKNAIAISLHVLTIVRYQVFFKICTFVHFIIYLYSRRIRYRNEPTDNNVKYSLVFQGTSIILYGNGAEAQKHVGDTHQICVQGLLISP
jgi:hypothetical protein